MNIEDLFYLLLYSKFEWIDKIFRTKSDTKLI